MTSDSTLQSTLKSSIADLGNLDGVASVVGPFDNDALFSSDGTVALANVAYSNPFQDLPDNGVDAFDDLSDSVSQYRSSDLQIELGGSLPGAQPTEVEPILVIYGLIAALVILLVALGTWWSLAWPVAGALVGVGLGVGAGVAGGSGVGVGVGVGSAVGVAVGSETGVGAGVGSGGQPS